MPNKPHLYLTENEVKSGPSTRLFCIDCGRGTQRAKDKGLQAIRKYPLHKACICGGRIRTAGHCRKKGIYWTPLATIGQAVLLEAAYNLLVASKDGKLFTKPGATVPRVVSKPFFVNHWLKKHPPEYYIDKYR
jgi:hypothetical protein